MLLSWKMKLNIDVLKLVDDLWRLRSTTVFFDPCFIGLSLLAVPFHLCSIDIKRIQVIILIEQILASKYVGCQVLIGKLTSHHHRVELVEIWLSSIRHLCRIERKRKLWINISNWINHKVVSLTLWEQSKWI